LGELRYREMRYLEDLWVCGGDRGELKWKDLEVEMVELTSDKVIRVWSSFLIKTK